MGTALIQFIPSNGPDSNSYQKNGARNKSDFESASSSLEQQQKQRWPLWKKMVIFAFLLVLIIPFAVGVPVGMCIKKSHAPPHVTNAPSSSASASVLASASASVTASEAAAEPSALRVTASHPPTSVWQPPVGATWQIVLSELTIPFENGKPTPDVDIYDVDLFDVSPGTITDLHRAGKKVICYFSAGSYEDWRPDAKDWDQGDLGAGLDGWAGEKWVKTSSNKVRSIMRKRLAMAAKKGCDGVDPDNVDAYNNENGLGLSEADAADYVRFLGEESAKLNLSCGLKNAAALLLQVKDAVQFSVVEQCGEYKECAKYEPMIQAGKPVFAIEYPAQGMAITEQQSEFSAQCNADGSAKFSKVLKNMNLDTWVEFCDGRQDL